MLRKVPKGKVTTYGALAKACKTSPRAVGQIMRRNPRPDIYPCFKVIKTDGNIGGFGGETNGKKIDEKIKLLRKNGIKVIKKNDRYLIPKEYIIK